MHERIREKWSRRLNNQAPSGNKQAKIRLNYLWKNFEGILPTIKRQEKFPTNS